MAQKAFGTLLKIGDGASPEVFTSVGEILSISPGGLTSATIDTTHMETAGGYRTFISDTFKDPGETSCTIQYDPSDLDTLYGYVGTSYNFQVVYPDSPASTEAFAGVFMSFVPSEATLEGKLEGSITIKRSGAPTVT